VTEKAHTNYSTNRHRQAAAKIVLWLAVVLALFVGADRLLALGLHTALGASEFRYSQLYAGKIDADIIVFGDSRGVSNYQPEIWREKTGVAAFDLSYNQMTAEVAAAILDDYLARNRKPKRALIEMTLVLWENALLPELKMYSPDSPGLRGLLRRNLPKIAVASRLFATFPYNGEMYFRALSYLGRDDQAWSSSHEMTAVEFDREAASADPMAAEIRPDQLEALAQMVEKLEENGIRVDLLISPMLPVHAARFPALKTISTAVAGRLPGRQVHDYSTEIKDFRFFADAMHLNRAGAATWSDRLVADGHFGMPPAGQKNAK
jgi:hypothetical protein